MKSDNLASAAAAKAASGRIPAGSSAANDKVLTLRLEAAHVGSAVVLRCRGPVIFRTEARSLCSVISEVLPSARRMVVDLAGVLSLDSDALGELVMTQMWADAAGYSLTFACPSESVRGLFESANLVSVFDVHASVAEAMSAMHQGEAQSA